MKIVLTGRRVGKMTVKNAKWRDRRLLTDFTEFTVNNRHINYEDFLIKNSLNTLFLPITAFVFQENY